LVRRGCCRVGAFATSASNLLCTAAESPPSSPSSEYRGVARYVRGGSFGGAIVGMTERISFLEACAIGRIWTRGARQAAYKTRDRTAFSSRNSAAVL